MKKFFKDTFRFIGALLALVKGIMLLAMLAVVVMAVYFINMAAHVTINQYNESLVWEKINYEAPLAEIEPALVSNVIDTDIVDAATAWEALEEYLDSLDGKSIPDREHAVEILNEAVYWQKIYDLESDSITRLYLYLELEDAISDAYITLDTTDLQTLGTKLYNLEMEESTAAGQSYMERLREVSYDFEKAKTLMTNTVWSVGTVEDGIWTIPYTYTRTNLTEVLEQLQSMQKFPAICDTADVLSDISTVLNYNKNAREYFQYQEFKEAMSDVNRSQYTAVSNIYTYGQALSFGCDVQVEEQAGYTVSLNSLVEGIYYNGERLDNDQYVKKGTKLTAVISEIYEPIPESQLYEVPLEEEEYYE